MPADKARRQRAILDLIEGRAIPSQEALALALRRKGFAVTQATLSRDLKELRVLRVPTPGGYRYSPAAGPGAPEPGGARLGAISAEEVVGVAANEVSLIVRTLTGRAQGVAVYLDGLGHEDILGTLAGDDTILVLPRSVKRTSRLERDLRVLFGL